MKYLMLGVLVLAGAGHAQAGFVTVGVVYGGNSSGQLVVNQLNDTTTFNFLATGLNASQADTLAELSGYNVIVLGDSGYRDHGYTPAMYAAIRQYMQNGGGVVTTSWYNYATNNLLGQAKIDADFISPIVSGLNHKTSPGTVSILNNTHPITAGISNYSFSGGYVEVGTGVDSGAVKLGGIVGTPSAVTIAYQDQTGRSVYLGGLYFGHVPTYNNSGLRVGSEDRLLEQSVNWAGGSQVTPTATATPEPASMTLLGAGACCLMGLGRLRRKYGRKPEPDAVSMT